MKRFLSVGLVLLIGLGCQTAPDHEIVNGHRSSSDEVDDVILANGPVEALPQVMKALDAAGIHYGASGGRGIFGITVQRRDARHAHDVLVGFALDQHWLVINDFE